MQTHSLKTHEPFWDAVKSGQKNFEIRRNDRDFQKGDVLVLQKTKLKPPHEYILDGFGPKAKPEELRRIVTYVLPGGQFGIEVGYVVMGLATPDQQAPS